MSIILVKIAIRMLPTVPPILARMFLAMMVVICRWGRRIVWGGDNFLGIKSKIKKMLNAGIFLIAI
jgi:hypothetical protein